MTKKAYETAADVFERWRDEVLTGTPPVHYPVGTGALARIEIGPKLVTLVGGAPGAGKTALTMQLMIDALRLTRKLRVCVCNIEMPSAVLLDRQLSRLSGIDLAAIRYRKLNAAHADRLDQALNTIEQIADRLCFVRPPFNLASVAAAADEFDADVIVLDYIQRIPPPGHHNDRRGAVDATMSYLREFADAGVAVVVVAAVARQKDRQGRSSYAGDSMSLASFRESSELEFGADDAYILTPELKMGDAVRLRHLKARHTEPSDIVLAFDRNCQSFTSQGAAVAADRRLHGSLASLWQQTELATDELEFRE